MKILNAHIALATSLVLWGVGSAWAIEAGGVSQKTGAVASKAHQTVATVKLVDINGANKAALKKLPGIGDAEADKMIANRPYGSKMWLITDKVLERKTYDGIKGLIEARQPYKTAEENAAMYEKLKKERADKATKVKP